MIFCRLSLGNNPCMILLINPSFYLLKGFLLGLRSEELFYRLAVFLLVMIETSVVIGNKSCCEFSECMF